jgi:hypothetical protein
MKRQRERRRLLTCGLAAMIVLAPAHAAAQTDPERPMIRVGPFELRPRLLFNNIGLDYNVFNEHTDPKRDFTFTAAPDIEVSVHPGRLRVAYTSGSEFVYYRTYTSERSINRSFAGRADLDLTILKPFFAMTSAHTSARPNSEIDVRVRHHPRTYSGGTTVKIASRTSMAFTARRSTESYDDGFEFRGMELSKFLNNRTVGYESSLNLELTPFTTVSLVAEKQQTRFDHDPTRNSDSIRVAPTVTFSPLGQITGTASVGYRQFNGLDPSLPDYAGFVATGAIGLVLGGQYRLTTSFTRDVRYSYEEALPYYVVSGGRATLAVQTVRALDIRFTGGRESMDYRALAGATAPGTDWMTVYGGGLGYRIAGRLQLLAEAEFWHRTSELEMSREYRNKRFMITLNWGATNR